MLVLVQIATWLIGCVKRVGAFAASGGGLVVSAIMGFTALVYSLLINYSSSTQESSTLLSDLTGLVNDLISFNQTSLSDLIYYSVALDSLQGVFAVLVAVVAGTLLTSFFTAITSLLFWALPLVLQLALQKILTRISFGG